MATATSPKNSTTVRNILSLGALRAGFAISSVFAPRQTARRAARLFATPFASSRSRARAVPPDADMQRLNLHSGGRKVATYVWGDPATQPYALLVHGWSSFGLRFQSWVGRLRALGYAVVTFDQPGHGHSGGDKCTLPEFSDTLRSVGRHFGNAALVIAHSFGGAAVSMALDESWHASRLVLIAPPADMIAATDRFFRFMHLGARLREPFYGWHEQRTGVHPRDLQAYRHLATLGQPALIVHDLDDREVPWEEGECYARHWPGARMLSTSGLGHNRIVDDPGVIDAALRFARGEAVGERVVSTPNLPYGIA
jgi:pimeloyl-ACP methyl ester carboxylesterase